MNKNEILDILKTAAGFELEKKSYGYHGFGSINKNFNGSDYEYINIHYPKMKNLLESIPWDMVIKNPRNPSDNEYPKEDGTYITMMDCNEHEVCTNTFKNGRFTWMNKTHIKWWMKLPE